MARHGVSFLTTDIDTSIKEIISSLVVVDVLNGRYRVSLPIVMPSGGLVDVSVYREPGATFLVSDDGAAFFEVSGFGVTRRSFSAVAKDRANRIGATYDGDAFLYLRVTESQLKAAIISIGNLSATVASEVVERSVKAKHDNARERLFRKIDEAFHGHNIAHDVEVYGESTASYQFDAMVETGGHKVVFDIFTKDPGSIAATYTKLSDVYRSEGGPRLVGVTKNFEEIGPKLTLISSVAKVIRIDSDPMTFAKAAA